MKTFKFKKLRGAVSACAAMVMAGGAMAQALNLTELAHGSDEALNARINNSRQSADQNARSECIGPRCADGPGTVGFNEGRQCWKAMDEWDKSSRYNARGPLSMWTPPPYDCYKSAMLNRLAGNFSMNWSAPSVVEYRAWVLAYTGYRDQSFVQRTAVVANADVDAFGDAFHIWLVKPAINYNVGLLVEGKTYLLNANPMLKGLPGGTGRSSGLGGGEAVSEVCSKGQRDATLGIENKIVRDLALKQLKITCAGAEEKVAASKAAAAAAEAKQAAYQLPTEADLHDTAKVFRASDADLLAFFAQEGLPSRTVGIADAPAKLQVVLDFADWRTRLLLMRVWPAVIDGQLQVRIVPTSLGYFSPEANAAFLATPRPIEFIQNWLTKGLEKEGPAAARVLDVQTASTRPTPGAMVAHQPEVLQINGFVEKSKITILPSMTITNGTLLPPQQRWSIIATDLMLAGVGIKAPNTYTKEQVAFMRLPRSYTNFSTESFPRTIQWPFIGDFEKTLVAAPDFSGAKELCSAEKECWKAPGAGDGTTSASGSSDSAGMKVLKGAAWVLFNKN